MRDLNHDFKNLCQRNRDGSFATQHDRERLAVPPCMKAIGA